jgi:uracil phosphoribosyltransferase
MPTVPSVTVARHPLVRDKLARLRGQDTAPPEFRALVRDLSRLLFYEALADAALEAVTVRTPLAECPGQRLAERIGLVPILRAGLGMADAILELVPQARVWHLGLYRDHDTHLPVTYYNKLPADAGIDVAYVVDPMLATGGSAVQAIDLIKSAGAGPIQMLCVVAAPEGVKRLSDRHPDVEIFAAAFDRELNDRKYILPGLGDYGDRLYGTFE